MGMIIEVDTIFLERDRQAAQQKLDRVRALITEIYRMMSEIDAMWDGPANAVFRQQFERDREQFNALFREAQAFLESLAFAVAEYEKCDNQVRAAVSAVKI